MNFENSLRKVERMAESKIFPDRSVFVSIVGREIKEKVEKYSIVLPLLLILKINLSATKMNFEKRRREVERGDEFEIFLNRHVLVPGVG